MIEFAPNPTGPAHLGTLRTYLVAYQEAKRRRLPLYLRFDAHGWDNTPGLYDEQWAKRFLEQLTDMGIPPDHWEWSSGSLWTEAIPKWARLENEPEHLREFAYYPHTQLQFAYRTDRAWEYSPELVNLIAMNLRGTSEIVRCLKDKYIRRHEIQAGARFCLGLPAVFYTPVVTLAGKAMRKRRMAIGDPGTVDAALDQIGAAGLLECLRRSIDNTPIGCRELSVEEIMSCG